MCQADISYAVTLWDMIKSSTLVWGVREWLVYTTHSFDLIYSIFFQWVKLTDNSHVYFVIEQIKTNKTKIRNGLQRKINNYSCMPVYQLNIHTE